MRVIEIRRNIRKQNDPTASARRSVRQFGHDFLARENHVEFALAALLFGVLVVISAWPIAVAAGAINQFL
jgi:hypothetical protein